MLANKTKLRLIRDATQAYPGTPVNSALWYYLRDRYQDNLSVATLIGKFLSESGYAYSFDGVDDRGVLAYRAINPDVDIDISWRQVGVNNSSAAPRSIVTQSLSTVIGEREFVLRWSGNSTGLLFSVGGVGATYVIPCVDGHYRVTYSGTTVQVFHNGVQVAGGSLVRGASREPTAVTNIGCRNSGGSYTEFCNGALYDINMNGVLYPINEPNQAIQLPNPAGLGAELITPSVLASPNFVTAQWSYLGGGRWKYAGDGQGDLVFVNTANIPEQGYIEYEVESYERISGVSGMRISPTSTNFFGDRLFSSTGVKRAYYTAKPVGISFTRNNSGELINCVIKNISFKPLGTCNPLTLVNTASTGWQEIDV